MADELSIDSKALIFATLADVYLSSGMLDEAISILKDGLARNPNYTLAKIILGRAYYMKGETDEALKILEAIYPEAKDSENENLFLGHCYKRAADFDKARKHYEAVLRINPDNKEAKKEITALGIMPVQVPETVSEVKIEPKSETIYEPPSEIEVKPLIDIKGMDQSVPIKEVVLPEGDITADEETPEPDMGIQEPILKISVPPPVSETMVKGEIEIVLPTRGEDATDVKQGAEAIPEADVPISGAEAKQETEVPVSKTTEKPPEIIAAESGISDELKKRIEALAAQAANIEKDLGPEPIPDTKQEADVPVSGAEAIQEADVPVSEAEAKQETEVPVSDAAVPINWLETKNEAEAIQKVEEILKAEVPVKETESKGEAKRKKRETGKKEPEPAEEVKAEAKKKEPEPVAEAKQEADVPVSGAEAIPGAEVPVPPLLFAEEMKAPKSQAAPIMETGTPFDRLNVPMEKLLSLKTVNAAFISARDGLLIKNYAEQREDIEEISALVASIFNEALESFKFLDEGAVDKIIIENKGETICVITAGESLLCVFTKPEAKPGLIFVYARKIIDEIREVLG